MCCVRTRCADLVVCTLCLHCLPIVSSLCLYLYVYVCALGNVCSLYVKYSVYSAIWTVYCVQLPVRNAMYQLSSIPSRKCVYYSVYVGVTVCDICGQYALCMCSMQYICTVSNVSVQYVVYLCCIKCKYLCISVHDWLFYIYLYIVYTIYMYTIH